MFNTNTSHSISNLNFCNIRRNLKKSVLNSSEDIIKFLQVKDERKELNFSFVEIIKGLWLPNRCISKNLKLKENYNINAKRK